ncbi:MAG TPA: GNAT family N-acetyltransferase [Alphaproteobacteria bacterium]|nr:GNAT family N-acetyltransferase [Alphaproteobacteria bacterium]
MKQNVEVLPYDPNWKELFEKESTSLKDLLKELIISLYHVGSTSIEGLSAKPIIDIIMAVKDQSIARAILQKSGYTYKGELNIPFRDYFTKKVPFEVNLHVYDDVNNPEIELNLLFKEYISTHEDDKKHYSALKMRLSTQEGANKNNGHVKVYTLGKDPFIKKILKKAGFQRLCLRFCTHYAEWDKAKELRQKYFFDPDGVQDPYTWTFNHKDHLHFIFYKGIELIGYGHVQLWPDNRAILRILVLEEAYQKNGFGNHFLALIEQYLIKCQVKRLHIDSVKEALSFYQNFGYDLCELNDPEGHERYEEDISIAKNLF